MKLSAKLVSHKKGIELSINFIIVISFAILILIMGIYLFTQVLNQGQELTQRVTEETRGEINSLLDKSSDTLIVLPRVIQEIASGEVAHFPLGVRSDTSRCSGGASADFVITTTFDSALVSDAVGNVYVPSDTEVVQIEDWYLTKPHSLSLGNNDKEILDVPILAGSGARSGYTYGFDIEIRCGNVRYGDYSNKIFITVK
jgi:hypothetical protein